MGRITITIVGNIVTGASAEEMEDDFASLLEDELEDFELESITVEGDIDSQESE